MRELKDEKLKYKLDKIYKNILKLKRLDVDNYYCANLLDWFNEVILKNIAIYKSKKSEEDIDQELFKKSRQYVYWIDFGRNIGSEFRDLHFAVVIYESKYTALVVPKNIAPIAIIIPFNTKLDLAIGIFKYSYNIWLITGKPPLLYPVLYIIPFAIPLKTPANIIIIKISSVFIGISSAIGWVIFTNMGYVILAKIVPRVLFLPK